jgi:hypothetical protein
MTQKSTRFVRIADGLAQLEAGSDAADQAIHQALGRPGPVQPYTTDEAAARSLLPEGFEWLDPVYSAGAVYAACRRSGTDDGLPHPHHGQWGRTALLAACGAAMRAYAKLQQE